MAFGYELRVDNVKSLLKQFPPQLDLLVVFLHHIHRVKRHDLLHSHHVDIRLKPLVNACLITHMKYREQLLYTFRRLPSAVDCCAMYI